MNELKKKNQELSLKCKALNEALEGILVFSAFLLAAIMTVLFELLINSLWFSLFLGVFSGFIYYGGTKISVYSYLIIKLGGEKEK